MHVTTELSKSGPPPAIYIFDSGDVSVYRGTPLEMVRQMAQEMEDGEGVPDVFEAVDTILECLADYRDIYVDVDLDGVSDESVMAEVLVQVLLRIGVARPMPQA